MDYRRRFGLRAPRPIGDSTILVPQLENYSLFATPFLDLNKKIVKLIEGVQQDVKSQSADDSTEKRTTRQMIKKKEEDSQKPSEETSKASDSFGIVLNVVTVKPEQFSITFGKGNEIEVKVEQKNVKSEYGSMPFSRNCTYKYELPDDVDRNSLVALWTSDDYLIILPEDNLRRDLLNKSIGIPEALTESSDKDVGPSVEATGSENLDGKSETKPETSKSKDTRSKKASKSEDGSEISKQKKEPVQEAGESVAKKVEEVYGAKCAMPLHPVTRMLRPELDIFMLRKYMLDLESYISTARKFVENASFLSQNSKSAERCIRFLANLHADEFYEKVYLKGVDRMRRKFGEPSPDSGYSTSEGNVSLKGMLQK
ncbi:unnamed protein product [Larinioides sclopetarius]|uniref:SHSP domain-containing protein n=1 Tax=Larinioides sclopetarius TaxID=280406 RepID=A0AAV2A9B0_9ARAC